MQKAVDFSCELGIRQIQLAGYDVYYEESTDGTRRRFFENLVKSIHMTEKAGVILAFETMENPFMDTAEKAMHYVRKIVAMTRPTRRLHVVSHTPLPTGLEASDTSAPVPGER